MLLHKTSIAGVALDSAGLVALADLSLIKQRTALMGSASYFDIFFLAPGIHTQQDCTGVNGGELPYAGDMKNDYVFRIENPGTVSYLQSISEPGYLVTVQVTRLKRRGCIRHFEHLYIGGFIPSLLYILGIAFTITSIALVSVIRDFWATAVLLLLIVARAINTVVVMSRCEKGRTGWKGGEEPQGKKAALIILLSQDRWVCMKGLTEDIKLVTAGQWLSDPSPVESFAAAFAMLLVYVAAALAINGTFVGNLIIAVLLLVSAGILSVCNSLTKDLHMFGCKVRIWKEGEKIPDEEDEEDIKARQGDEKGRHDGRRKYERRSEMATELLQKYRKQPGKAKWATKMDLLTKEAVRAVQERDEDGDDDEDGDAQASAPIHSQGPSQASNRTRV
ncbi:hypothetical protein NM688_g2656 [Phlebia brevispora]|uniref:Uncharacterized protein n=1 Tax=Phlebia brevispora TaxID=194682 RepID=A0ACC1T870_9APHY|nr:hypothetical protein NM688_g2656 [Phlebia brevispora]